MGKLGECQNSNAGLVTIQYHHNAGLQQQSATDNNIGKLGANIEMGCSTARHSNYFPCWGHIRDKMMKAQHLKFQSIYKPQEYIVLQHGIEDPVLAGEGC